MAANPLIEEHLFKIGAELRVRGRYRDRVLAEIRAHLEDATDAAMARGLAQPEATELAIADVGTASAVAERFTPQASGFTRLSIGMATLGVVLAAASSRAANELHADGARLGSSALYTVVWAVGWVSLLFLASPMVALFVRHRGRLGRSGALSIVALSASALAALGFHFANDGSLSWGPDADLWRSVLVVLGAVATLALAAMIRRTRLVSRWPLVLIGSGLALVAVHYLILREQGGATAIAGLLLLAAGGSACTIALGRQRPLA